MFLHVCENVPAEPEHPTQGEVAVRKLVGTAVEGCAAIAGAIERVAIARPATNRDEAFMAISQGFRDSSWRPGARAYASFQKGLLEFLDLPNFGPDVPLRHVRRSMIPKSRSQYASILFCG